MLTDIAALINRFPRFGHWLAARLGVTDLHRMFCVCAPCAEDDADLW